MATVVSGTALGSRAEEGHGRGDRREPPGGALLVVSPLRRKERRREPRVGGRLVGARKDAGGGRHEDGEEIPWRGGSGEEMI